MYRYVSRSRSIILSFLMIVSLTNCMTAMTGGGMMSPSHAALNWSDADPSVFPSGLRAVYKATGWPVVAHARAWAVQHPCLGPCLGLGRAWAVPWAVPGPGGRQGAIAASPTFEAHGLASRADHQDVLRRDLREMGTCARRRVRACLHGGQAEGRGDTARGTGSLEHGDTPPLSAATPHAASASGCASRPRRHAWLPAAR